MPLVRRRLRPIAFWGIAAWMLLSPATVQVFGARWGAVQGWRMFHSRGGGICSARFYADGERVDRYALLGQSRAKAPDAFRRITSEQAARAMAGQLCAKLGPGVDLRLELRCADNVRFTTLVDREVDLCP
jgi:hypothetical protein